jgi:hypothetical protein
MAKYRNGSKVGHTLYRDDAFVGSCVSPEHAAKIVSRLQCAEELARALDVFSRLCAIMDPLDLSDQKPVREFAPGVWPTMKDCRIARAALAKWQAIEKVGSNG